MSTNHTSERPPLDAETVERTKQQIRALVNEIAQLSKSDLEPQAYYPAFLQRVVSALAAAGGAVWTIGEGGRLKLAYHIKISETLLDPDSDDAARHLKLLYAAMRSGQGQLVPPMSGPGDEGAGANPTRHLLVLAPLRVDGQLEGLVEVFQRPDTQPATQRGYLRFLQQMCDLAADWLKTRKLRQFSDRHTLWAQADHFARLVHESLDLRETAYTIVNEGRRLIGCDRVSVAVLRRGKCRVEAVSGQDTLEKRSNIVAGLGKLATRVCAAGEPLWYEGSTEDLPPQIENVLQDYVDEAHSRAITVLPLRKPDPPDARRRRTATGEADDETLEREIIGALIIEQFETELPQELLAPRVDLVYEHAARALANALEHNSIFLMPVWKAVGKTKWLVQARTLPKTLAVTAAALALILWLCLYPADFTLRADGVLQPVVRRDVFADVEGVVVNVPFGHGDAVREGDVVAELRNPDLMVQWEQTQGERSSTGERIATLQRELNRADLPDAERAQLTSELAMLRSQLKSLDRQAELLQRKLDRLKVRSPITGVIITWDAKRLLMNRTVAPGQTLLTVADTSDGWELELLLRESRMGHVNRALRELQTEHPSAHPPPLPVEYILATDPAVTRHGVVKDVDPAAHLDQEEGHVVRVLVRPDEEEIRRLQEAARSGRPTRAELRPGASVKAELLCGRRAIGYVWFHEAIEWVQVHVLFPLL